jgi:sulfur relay (sulfurtransferase) DsrF/TusC family protein
MGLSIMLAMDQSPDSILLQNVASSTLLKTLYEKDHMYMEEKLGDVNISPQLIILYLALGFFLDQVLLIQLLVLFYQMPLQLSS